MIKENPPYTLFQNEAGKWGTKDAVGFPCLTKKMKICMKMSGLTRRQRNFRPSDMWIV